MKFIILKNLNLRYTTLSYLIFIYCILIIPAFSLGSEDETGLASATGKNATSVSLPDTKILKKIKKRLKKYKNIDKVETSDVISRPFIPLDVTSTPHPVTSTEKDGLWCYCNFAYCVPSRYMCRSEEGAGCFSKLPEQALSRLNDPLHSYSAVDTFDRGCIEFLTKEERHYCETRNQESEEENVDGEHQHRLQLRCCNGTLCNYELPKPIIVKEIEEREVIFHPSSESFLAILLVLSVMGIMFLISFIIFICRLFISGKKEKFSEFNEHMSRDLYIRVPFYVDKSPDVPPSGGENYSVLCAKTLQRVILQNRQKYVADYCKFHPLANSNRHSLSCPSSLDIFHSGEEEREELQPLKRDESFLLVHVEPPEKVSCQ